MTRKLCIATFVLGILASLSSVRAEDWTIPKSHPRLLIHRDDLAAMRVRCGIDRYHDDTAARTRGIRFGSQADLCVRLKAAATGIMRGRAASDDLWAPAILHLVTGELGRADSYTEYVTAELLDPNRRLVSLDTVIALDYCWDAIEREKRSRIVDRWADVLESFEPGENPLSCLRFDRKLFALALAIVLADEREDDQNAGVAVKVGEVLQAAKNYIEGDFVRFCQQRGAMPSSAGNAACEEAMLVLAAEIWRTGAGRSIWPELTDNVGRAMEHYFYADTDCATIRHGFVHDDGSTIPLRPGQIDEGFIPALPWAIARNTQDPIAIWYANRSFSAAIANVALPMERYLWVPLVYGPLEQAEAARRACPTGRHFGGGWVAMRSGWDPGETVVLFDTGQPFWQSRQHFDAGQFQIYRKERLAIDSGDDVTYEAVPRKGGQTTIGDERGDWDQYYQATIAHNCMTVSDRTQRMALYGRVWPAMGNQRLVGHDYDLTAGDVTKTERHTGSLTAFETNSFYTYAAADLTPAYSPEVVNSIRRRMLFLNNGALLVLDKLTAIKSRSIKTWHLQLPTRPKLLGESQSSAQTRPADEISDTNFVDLAAHARQIHGTSEYAGIWQLDKAVDWLQITNGPGRLFVRTLLPESAKARVVGGSMQPRKIMSGPMAGRDYYGGDPLGYEHRLGPATFLRSPNAAYMLGQPMNLGEQFGVGATWGRLDVAPVGPANQVTFLHLLIPTDSAVRKPPATRFEHKGKKAIVYIAFIDQNARVELSLDGDEPGMVSIQDRLTKKVLFEKSLTTSVQPNLPIPGSAR